MPVRPPPSDPLIGRCFVVLAGKRGAIERQGVIEARIEPGHYLVRYSGSGDILILAILPLAALTSSPESTVLIFNNSDELERWLEREGRTPRNL